MEILRYVCVEDCGVAIHPRVVEGQARGGIAQGIAGALFEQVVYDELGQPLAPSFMEYKVPTAAEIPDVRIEHLETPWRAADQRDVIEVPATAQCAG